MVTRQKHLFKYVLKYKNLFLKVVFVHKILAQEADIYNRLNSVAKITVSQTSCYNKKLLQLLISHVSTFRASSFKFITLSWLKQLNFNGLVKIVITGLD